MIHSFNDLKSLITRRGGDIDKEINEYCYPFTDEQQMILSELTGKLQDARMPYWEYCIVRNYASNILKKAEKEGTYNRINKEGAEITAEQWTTIKELRKTGWKDVAHAYYQACEQETYTDEWKARILLHQIEGADMTSDNENW